ncbi:MAG: flagellar motor protein MotA [Alphaproteobacteria bacterium]|nr:flagellar motor protein MotA [Alphaproteobacteria bacterium]
MNGPRRYLIRMLLFIVAVGVAVAGLFFPLVDAFMANPALNGLIVGVLILGMIYIFRQVALLIQEVAWIESFRNDQEQVNQTPPKLLAPMAAMLGERKGQFSLSALSLRSLLDGISSRLEESRDLSRYLIGLLIFLGLLGTFWGLLQTIGAVGDVIGSLSVGGGDLAKVFTNLKAGLKAPLAGMGTAFSSSLLGLAGSLILGFLELQAGQAQNRFYNDLEDWLAGQTRLSSGSLAIGEGDQGVPAYVQALLEQTADSLESLQRTLERGEESRISANSSVVSLTDKLDTLTDQMRTEQSLMIKLAETQLEMKPLLASIADASTASSPDETMSKSMRSIDTQLARLIEELGTGRNEVVSELRSEIRVLSRTMAAIAERANQ